MNEQLREALTRSLGVGFDSPAHAILDALDKSFAKVRGPASVCAVLNINDYKVRLGRIKGIHVGTAYHDGRGFISVYAEGKGWGYGGIPLRVEHIDTLIACCDASDLSSCKGNYVRVLDEKGSGVGFVHPMDDEIACVFSDVEPDRKLVAERAQAAAWRKDASAWREEAQSAQRDVCRLLAKYESDYDTPQDAARDLGWTELDWSEE